MRPARRDRSQFERFAAEHGAGLVKLAYVVCGDRERAQDATQEALIRVLRRWPDLDQPLAYARRTVVNATREDWRRHERRDRIVRRMQQLPAPRAAPDPQEHVPRRDALMRALDSLPHEQRAVIVLRFGFGLSEADTATTLDVPIGTVKSRANRALARLRQALAPEQIIPSPLETRA
jgi:RNA polymerase sigma-70 factor (sigma-E family)